MPRRALEGRWWNFGSCRGGVCTRGAIRANHERRKFGLPQQHLSPCRRLAGPARCHVNGHLLPWSSRAFTQLWPIHGRPLGSHGRSERMCPWWRCMHQQLRQLLRIGWLRKHRIHRWSGRRNTSRNCTTGCCGSLFYLVNDTVSRALFEVA